MQPKIKNNKINKYFFKFSDYSDNDFIDLLSYLLDLPFCKLSMGSEIRANFITKDMIGGLVVF